MKEASTRFGTFVERVRGVVARIPRGTTLSYKEVARRAGNPDAARAVGSLMRVNLDPRVPCHRVVRSDGSLGGYNRGPSRKESLLRREGVNISGGVVIMNRT